MLKLIACVTSDGGLGKDNKLLVKMDEDMEHFKRKTIGHTVVMGRKTWESLSRKPLPNRRNIVMTNQPESIPGAETVNSIEDIIGLSKKEDVFIIGGAEIYSLFLEHAQVLEMTEVDGVFPADTFFPEFDNSKFKVTHCTDVEGSNLYGVFKTYEKI